MNCILDKEPDRLLDEKTTIQQNIQDLICSNYKTFIYAADNSNEIFKEVFKFITYYNKYKLEFISFFILQFNQTESKLDNLLENIPEFINKCKSFCIKSEEINIHKRLNSLILKKNTELVEILELPQLMKLYLQNNEYNEALEISQYVKLINGKFGDIPIIIVIM
jgi:hypothetical protein